MFPGRSFILRLENGEILHQSIELFAQKNNIQSATVLALGGADDGSKIIVGPRDGHSLPVEAMLHILKGPQEMTGNGTIFQDESGSPMLHMHASFGRDGRSVTGCVRAGVKVWLIMEVVIQELVGANPRRLLDLSSGFALLDPVPGSEYDC